MRGKCDGGRDLHGALSTPAERDAMEERNVQHTSTY
jgi:hypothetical protein